MSEEIRSLQSQFLLEHEKARLDRELNGDYTKAGLRHLIAAARIQYQLAALTDPEAAKQHTSLAEKIVLDAHAHMVRLGLIVPSETEARLQEASAAAGGDAQPAAPEQKSAADSETDPHQELAELIGLKQAKKKIRQILDVLQNNINREKTGLPPLDIPLHMVFAGHAGTGKTTVARIVARILKQMGLLSKGHLVEVKSSDLIADHVGGTGKKTEEVVNQALGGVLFIDEAYALAENKFGKEDAIPVLLTGMENNKDFAVIVAGYTDNMQSFLKANEGLRSRFDHFVHFEDYSCEEMVEIFKSMAKRKSQRLSPEAEEELRKLLDEKSRDEDFGNARGVRKIFNQANMAQAGRVVALVDEGAPVTQELVTTFEAADIREAAEGISDDFLDK